MQKANEEFIKKPSMGLMRQLEKKVLSYLVVKNEIAIARAFLKNSPFLLLEKQPRL